MRRKFRSNRSRRSRSYGASKNFKLRRGRPLRHYSVSRGGIRL